VFGGNMYAIVNLAVFMYIILIFFAGIWQLDATLWG